MAQKEYPMLQFMTSNDLANAIKDVLAGTDVRCAVAFWGIGAETLLNKAGDAQPRIICDVMLGGTSPNALRELGAPKNKDLRHIPGLHAKVYLSDRGAVIGSANASRNGVGLDGPPSLTEAGIRFAPDSETFRQAESWFEAQWEASTQVDDTVLDFATQRFRPGRSLGGFPVRPGSLLDLIAADPDRFSDVSIVLAETSSTQEEREQVRTAIQNANPGNIQEVNALPDNGMFIGWETQDLNRWKRTFIELWMPNQRLSVYGRQIVYVCDAEGTVMSRSSWRSISQLVGDELPSQAKIAATDAQIVRKLLNKRGNRLYNSYELAVEIEHFRTRRQP
ncbi:phospholipase D family protein [Acetobacter indonesiensis]|uniref:phospholipase D family protein n=1 Tax=Acetobacter indonesiensis TaxID=104101 RepID=UPI001F166C72|nr:phospholipase D family protein [Acetobacter indonesiensis]MCG0996467.1 phospholipase D family protein [Acetobacter indonesiensis]